MTNPSLIRLFVMISVLVVAPSVFGQQSAADASRQKTRDRLSQLLQRIGTEVKINFKPSEKQPFVFVGTLTDGLKNSESLEIVLRITTNDTIGIRVFPHYKGGYINIDKARNITQLLRQMAQFNDSTFLFWGADDAGDIFNGYTFTLESGFPDEAIRIVLASVRNSDDYVGKLRPSIDGSTGQ
jgi:hypothetical protein